MPEEITPGQILEALNNKADRDLTNVDQYLVKSNIISSLMPDWTRRISIGSPGINSTNSFQYTFTNDGWMYLYAHRDPSGYTLTVHINNVGIAAHPAWVQNYANICIPVSNNDVLKLTSDCPSSSGVWQVDWIYFCPCKGA